ncbi:MAG: hypothetical protein WC757_01660 [Candidatus Paceibacterota bacterium]|jgi:hypothetical protein
MKKSSTPTSVDIQKAQNKFLKKVDKLQTEFKAEIQKILKRIEEKRLADIKKKLGI